MFDCYFFIKFEVLRMLYVYFYYLRFECSKIILEFIFRVIELLTDG